MNLKSLVLCALVWAGFGMGTVHAQYAPTPATDQGSILGPRPALAEPGLMPSVLPPAEAAPGPGLSSWITYCRNGCHFPLGGDGPIGYEVYLRPGFNFPIGGGFFGKTLRDGWAIQGGGRTLFFDTE